MEDFNCPICNNNHKTLARYSNAVCNICIGNYPPRTNDNKLITFSNISISGGCVGSILNDDESYSESTNNECYINNIKCYASEARFGGIVILCYDK